MLIKTQLGHFSLTEINSSMNFLMWDVIIYPCPNFNTNLIKPLLKCGNGRVITSHEIVWLHFLIHSLIPVLFFAIRQYEYKHDSE